MSFCAEGFEVRGCSFYWYWWNCWFPNCWPPLA